VVVAAVAHLGLGRRDGLATVLDHQLQGTCICADPPGVESVVTAR
jgi:hypothetical protein